MTENTGRCLCRAVTYAFRPPINWCLHCHCESCRRNCAAAYATFVSVPNGQWRWTRDEPASYASSTGVERLFCRKCGTPVAYRNDELPDEIHFYLVGLDEPEAFAPERHVFLQDQLAWVHLGDDLPKYHGFTP
ncbi:MAG: GFA family protein [Pseudomonadota bacterium]